jgi:hypothetical protein
VGDTSLGGVGEAPANVNDGWVGRWRGRAVTRVRFAHLAEFSLVMWTLGAYSVRFAHFVRIGTPKWTKCTLLAADFLTLPTQPPLTFVDAARPSKRPDALDGEPRLLDDRPFTWARGVGSG